MKPVEANLKIRVATEADTSTIFSFIQQLAEFEKLSHEVVTDEEQLKKELFGDRKVAEVVIGESEGKPAAFALFFHNFSTFLGKPGIYLEDLFVLPEQRSKGFGQQMLQYLAKLAVERGCGRLEWSVLDWNEHAIRFYKSLGAEGMDEWTVHRLTGEAIVDLAESASS